jgi:hypothetical protein
VLGIPKLTCNGTEILYEPEHNVVIEYFKWIANSLEICKWNNENNVSETICTWFVYDFLA